MPARIPERSTGGEIIDGEKIRDSNLRELVVRPDFQSNGSSLTGDGARPVSVRIVVLYLDPRSRSH